MGGVSTVGEEGNREPSALGSKREEQQGGQLVGIASIKAGGECCWGPGQGPTQTGTKDGGVRSWGSEHWEPHQQLATLGAAASQVPSNF